MKYVRLPLIFAAVALGSMAAAETVDIPIELPKPFYGGTPTPYMGPNLEPIAIKNPEPIKAPAGAENAAKGKPVTSSKEPNFGQLNILTDGDKSHEEKALTEIGPGLQWVQIDLKTSHNIYGIMLWHYHAAERVYFDMVVQISEDPEFKKDVRTVYNADHDNSAELGAGKDKEYIETFRGRQIALPDGVQGRYVRLYSNGNDTDQMNHYIEVEVFGVPAK